MQLIVEEGGLRVGAAVPLTLLNEQMRELIATRPESETSTFRAVVEQLRWFAGVQVCLTHSAFSFWFALSILLVCPFDCNATVNNHV